MCYYIAQLYHYEITKMKCEFVKDFHGTIWFTYASDILVRPNKEGIKAGDARKDKIKKINTDHKQHLQKDMNSFAQQP